MRSRLALLLAVAICVIAGAAVRASGGPDRAGSLRPREHRLALQGEAKRPAVLSERRGGSRHAGGKEPLLAVLPAPLTSCCLRPAAALSAPCDTRLAGASFHPRLARGPPQRLS